MPRTKRELVDNGIYHVIHRGHNRSNLFEEYYDYEVFKSLLQKYKETVSFQLYHYCLMPNHVHLLLRIAEAAQMSKLIQGLAISYSHYARNKYDRVGCVFQGRYKSLPIERDSYMLECGRYIERNPVRAGIVLDPGDYKWSSYKFYVQDTPDCLVSVDPLYKTLGKSEEIRKLHYREYLNIPRQYELLVDNALGFKK